MKTIRGYGTREAARQLGLSPRTLEGYRTRRLMAAGRVGPPWIRQPNGRALYPAEGLAVWTETGRAQAHALMAMQRAALRGD